MESQSFWSSKAFKLGVLSYLLGAALLAVWMPNLRERPGDLWVYTLAADRASQGETFYRPDDPPAFSYPPLMVLPFAPISHFDAKIARSIWYFVNFLLLGASTALVTYLAVPQWKQLSTRLRILVPVILFVLCGRMMTSPIENQAQDLMILLVVAMAMRHWMKEEEVAAGIWAGVGAALKATPALFVLLFLCQRKWKAVAGFSCALLIGLVLPDLFYKNPEGTLWAHSWVNHFVLKNEVGIPANAKGAWGAWNHLNQSLGGAIYRLSVEPPKWGANWDVSIFNPTGPQLKAATISAQLSIIAFLAWCTWPSRKRKLLPEELRFQRFGEVGAVICGMLLLSPMSSKQHFCVLLIPMSFCVLDYLRWKHTRVAILTALMFFVFSSLGVKDLAGRDIGNTLLAAGSLGWCTLFCLITVGLSLRARTRNPQLLVQAKNTPKEEPRATPPLNAAA